MPAMTAMTAMTIPTEKARRRLVRRLSIIAGVGWVIFELLTEILLGPHIRLIRAIAVGSTLGLVVGLIISPLQWLQFRRYVPAAGWWIPATIAGTTLAGLASSLSLKLALEGNPVYIASLSGQGLIPGLIPGIFIAACQWPVLRQWARSGSWWVWVRRLALATALASPAAWLLTLGVVALLLQLMGQSGWPVVLPLGYLVGGLTGGILFGLLVSRAFNIVLPDAGPVISG